MKVPYNHLHAQGDILFAARGGKIHSFSLQDGSHISTWTHPDDEKLASSTATVAEAGDEADASASADAGPATEESEPPAKRQKLQEDADVSAAPEADAPVKRKGKKSKGNKNKKQAQFEGFRSSQVPDRPVITQLTATADGAHLLAVSGHDKNIWVFQHDGHGHIAELSQRTMPKRPSSVAISPDAQILCADKFGDVYALPLLPGAFTAPTPSSAKPQGPAASDLTVHSKRNRQALEHQRLQAERARQSGGDGDEDPGRVEGPGFELTLLLGHVSMLTAVALVEDSDGRRYVLTADRDEHVRVSRYVPQAHVIEGFCLGHKEFISSFVVAAGRNEILVSGGGDNDLFVWDWKAGSLLSKASVLSLAQTISPEATKVAVSGLFTLLFPSEAGNLTYIIAICEDVQAILSWQLTPDNHLNHPGIIQLPGSPLHLAACSASDNTPPRLVTAILPGEITPSPQSLHVFALTASEGRLSVDTDSAFQVEAREADELDVPEDEVRRLLFTVENLRKHRVTGAEEGDEGEGDIEVEGAG